MIEKAENFVLEVKDHKIYVPFEKVTIRHDGIFLEIDRDWPARIPFISCDAEGFFLELPSGFGARYGAPLIDQSGPCAGGDHDTNKSGYCEKSRDECPFGRSGIRSAEPYEENESNYPDRETTTE